MRKSSRRGGVPRRLAVAGSRCCRRRRLHAEFLGVVAVGSALVTGKCLLEDLYLRYTIASCHSGDMYIQQCKALWHSCTVVYLVLVILGCLMGQRYQDS